MNIWTFDFLYDLTEQYKSFTELILLYPYFIRVSWQQISQYIVWISLNVLTHLFWFTVWVNRIHLSISQGSFGYSCVHNVYSEFRVWLFDNNKFPQDSIFDTTLKSATKSFLYVYPRFSTTSTIVNQVFTRLLDSYMKRPKVLRGTCLKS